MSVDEVEPIEEEAADQNAVAPQGTHLASTQTVTHEYLTQSGKVMRETVTTNQTVTAVMDFVYDESGKPFAMIDQLSAQPKTYYYVLNLQGDVVKLIDQDGAVAAAYTYDAWGNILSQSGSMAEKNSLRYRGYYYDSETGFYYLQSRYYDPATRRFINADVYSSTDSSDAVSCNMFAYCNNNPVIASDENGEWLTFLIGAVVGAATEYVSQVVKNVKNGASISDALTQNINVKDIAVAALSGAVTACIGAGAGALAAKCSSKVAQVAIRTVGSGISNVVDDAIRGNIHSMSDAALSFGRGIETGVLTEAAAGLRHKQFNSLSREEQRNTLKYKVFKKGNYYKNWSWNSYASSAEFKNYLRRDADKISYGVSFARAVIFS